MKSVKIIKIPYSLGALEKSNGLERGPSSIAEELKNIWSSEDFHKLNFKLDEINLNSDIKDDLNEIYRVLLLKTEDFTIFLGGDHSITYACFKAISNKYSNCGILIFDSHPDCYKNFDYPVHEDWLQFLIEDGILKPENVMLIGVRNSDPVEMDFLRNNKIKFLTMKNMMKDKEKNCDMIMEICRNFDNLYISIDIDVLDPAFAPGTGYLEPGGFSSREFIYLVQRLKLLKNLKAIDIVEVNPTKDINNITSKLAAKLINEFL